MTPLPRRHFLAQTAAFTALPMLMKASAEKPSGLVDCNLYLGTHPNRTLPPVTADSLAKRGITEAWAAPLEALLHRDVAAVNARHAARCGGALIAVGTVHPGLPDWRDDLRRCKQEHGMNILRLHPGYHGYTLEDPRFLELLELATSSLMRLQIVAQMEDARTQHPMMQAAPVNLKPLAAAMVRVPEAKVMVLNASATMAQTALRGVPNVWLDIAMIEGVGGVENLLKQWPADRLVFGSHAPFFYTESSLLKLKESDLTADQLGKLSAENAVHWMG